MKRKIVSVITAVSCVIGSLPFTGSIASAASVTEKLFDSSVLSQLNLQPATFTNDGDYHSGKGCGMLFKETGKNHIKMKNPNSGNDLVNGYTDYEASNRESGNEWYLDTKWTPNSSQAAVLGTLINGDNSLKLTGRFSGLYDTQGGQNAGQAYMELKTSSESTKTKVSTDAKKNTFLHYRLGYINMKESNGNYYARVASTKGATGAMVKDRNYAKLSYPEVFMVDMTSPKVRSVTVEKNSDGSKNFVAGDKIRIDVQFTEPIRTKDYGAFRLDLFSGTSFSPIEYRDSDCTLVMEATVQDLATHQITKGAFKLTLNIDNKKITDIAGNAFAVSTKSFEDKDVVISGLIPRASKISYAYAEIKNGSNYEKVNGLQGAVKSGDRLYIDMSFNQDMQYFGASGKAITLNVNVGGSKIGAKLVSAMKSNKTVSSGATLPSKVNFDTLRFCLEVPQNISDGTEIYIDAAKSGDKWRIADISSLSDIKGNLILTVDSKRKSVDAVTSIKADGTRVLPIIKTDSTAPVISLTETDGTAAAVYESAEAADKDGAKENVYKICFKSDEEVNGSVKADLVCKSKTDPNDKFISNTVSMGAYTGSQPVKGMEVSFVVPKGYDSHDYDIYIETTAEDILHNRATKRFYLSADTKSPSVGISKERKGEGDNRYYEFVFDVTEQSSVSGTKVNYKLEQTEEEFSFTDADSNFTVESKAVGSEGYAGIIEYYAVDGSGNSSEKQIEHYNFSDVSIAECTPQEDTGEYLLPRDIVFTGFEAENEGFCDYFGYKIDDGDYTYIKNETGSDMTVPKEQLQNGSVIFYKRIRTADVSVDDNTESLENCVIYHCDDENPDMESTVIRNESENVSAVCVTAPVNHPKNIVKCEMTMNGSTVDVTDRFVDNGSVTAVISMDKVLEMYGLPSGEYSLSVTLTDANGHTSTQSVFENESIITDKPFIKGASIIDGESDNPFGDDVWVFGEKTDGENEAVMTVDSVSAMLEGRNGIPSADKYTALIEAVFRYEGNEFAKSDIEYTISEDGHKWTEYTSQGLTLEGGASSVRKIDGEKYASYKIALPLPEAEEGAHSYYIRLRFKSNPYMSDVFKIVTITDITAPTVAVAETAVGNDEDGWSEEVRPTNKYLKLSLSASDNGFYGNDAQTIIKYVRDEGGNDIYDNTEQYAEIRNSGDDTEIIIKRPCTVFLETADIWGNKTETKYVCELISNDVIKYSSVITDSLIAYTSIENMSGYTLYAQAPGETAVTEDGAARFEELVNNDIINVKNNVILGGKSNGGSDVVFALVQVNSSEPYDILCRAEGCYGEEEIFKIMTLEKDDTPIAAEPFLSGVANKGATIHAVQRLKFNKPVAQLGTDIARELNSGTEISIDSLARSELVYSTDVYAVLDYKSGSAVYVIDRFGNIEKVDVDTEGTEFIDYSGYSFSYEDIRDSGEVIQGNSDYIYGKNSEVNVAFDGNDGISLIRLVSENARIEGSNPQYIDNNEYFSSAVIKTDVSELEGEGTAYIADLKIYNINGNTEYNDAVVIKYDCAAPQLVKAFEPTRKSSHESKNVLYVFYDRHNIGSVEEDTGNGYQNVSYTDMYLAQYTSSCSPKLRIEDNSGNVLETDGVSADVQTQALFEEGVDYKINMTDENGDAAEDGKYYTSLTVSVESLPGGKTFMAQPQQVSVSSERAVVFSLTDETGASELVSVSPPIDVTPPSMRIVQNNNGEMVHKIIYSITVSDSKSGVASVYVEGEGDNGEDIVLKEENGVYTFVAYNAEEYTVCAKDNLGNITEQKASSNSSTVGTLEVNVEYNTRSITNKNVIAYLTSKDGRRIYTSAIDDASGENALTPQDYMLYGNSVSFRKNGTLKVLCVDELGDKKEVLLAVTNMDTTPPKVNCIVNPVYDKGELDPSHARITFKAEGADDGSGKVQLVRLKNNLGYTTDELIEIRNKYLENPANYEGDFKKLYDSVFHWDITLDTTYIDVDENGEHIFWFIDEAGNFSASSAKVDIIDDTAPSISSIKWNFEYLAPPDFKEVKTSEGTLRQENGVASLTPETALTLTNRPVSIIIEADEPVRIHGDELSKFSNTLTKTFTSNGNYQLVLEDKAGNLNISWLNVSNICKDDIYIELEDTSDIVLTEGNTDGFDSSKITEFKVYKYDSQKNKIYIDNAVTNIDTGGLNLSDINANTFNRNAPYTITYTAWDNAGNKAELKRNIVLCSKDDISVVINGQLPDSAGCIFLNGNSAKLTLNNYDNIASVKFAKGQFNSAQMKTRGNIVLPKNGSYDLVFDTSGWYTVSARTLYQDIQTVRIYVWAE